MSGDKGREPAFPCERPVMGPDESLISEEGKHPYKIIGTEYCPGVSTRLYVATAALQGMIAGSQGLNITVEQFAEQSLKLADALIAAESLTPEPKNGGK